MRTAIASVSRPSRAQRIDHNSRTPAHSVGDFTHDVAPSASHGRQPGRRLPCRRTRSRTPFKIGLILPMTGQSASTGRQIDAAVKLYMAQNGNTVAGKKIEVIVKDDAGVARHHAPPRAGAGRQRQGRGARRLRPHAAGAGHGADRHAGEDADGRDGRGHLGASPRRRPTSCAPASRCRRRRCAIAEWASKNGIKKVVTLVGRLRPGHRCREVLRRPLHAQRRQGAREAARAAAQPRLRAVPAEGARRQARCAVRVPALGRRARRS